MPDRLAINGGIPVRENMLPYGRQTISEKDINEVAKVLRSDLITTGPTVGKFEEAIAEFVGCEYAVAMSNATAALHASVYAADVGKDDEVITTPLTFVASSNCVLYQGGRVLFADVEHDTMNIDAHEIEKLITPSTRAILPVDYAGQPVDVDEINDIANKYDLKVIQDSAHSLGSSYKDTKTGSLTSMTVFSFHPVKHITTGEGGVVTTNDPILNKKLRLFRNHGISADHVERSIQGTWIYEMLDLGYNYRITDFQSALGISQLENLDEWIDKRSYIARRYDDAFTSEPGLIIPVVKDFRNPAWHLYVLRFDLDLFTVDRRQIFEALRAENIGVNVHYVPVPMHPFYRDLGYRMDNLSNTSKSYAQMLTLPIWPSMTDRDIDDTITAVKKVSESYRK